MINNSFNYEIESRVLAIMWNFLYGISRNTITQCVIDTMRNVHSLRRIDMSRIFFAFRSERSKLSEYKKSYCNERISQLTRAICVQNEDKSYSLASEDEIRARYRQQNERVAEMCAEYVRTVSL